MRVLGIDPGNQVTGYGVIEKKGDKLQHILHGEIKVKKTKRGNSLKNIYIALLDIINKAAPQVVAVEDIFYGKNVRSLIRQGEVRGISILAAAQSEIPVYQYTPLEVKKAVVGYGRAEKIQVQKMIKIILHLSDLPSEDAADALAVAICHANSYYEGNTLK